MGVAVGARSGPAADASTTGGEITGPRLGLPNAMDHMPICRALRGRSEYRDRSVNQQRVRRKRACQLEVHRSVEFDLPGGQVFLSGRKFPCAVPVEPRRGASLGVLLVGRVAVLVKFEDVGEDGEADLHLRRRILQLVPVVDALQHRMPDRATRDPASEATDRSRCTRTETLRHASNLTLASGRDISGGHGEAPQLGSFGPRDADLITQRTTPEPARALRRRQIRAFTVPRLRMGRCWGARAQSTRGLSQTRGRCPRLILRKTAATANLRLLDRPGGSSG